MAWEQRSEFPVVGSMQAEASQILSKRLQGASLSEGLGRALGQMLLRPLWPGGSRAQSPVIDPWALGSRWVSYLCQVGLGAREGQSRAKAGGLPFMGGEGFSEASSTPKPYL